MRRQIIITIDGPAGAGKSTLGRRLAHVLAFRYLDSGALYRAVAWQALQTGLDPADGEAVARLLPEFRPGIAADGGGFRLSVNGRDLNRELRSPEVTQAASQVATQPPVRRWVGEVLRRLAQGGGVVAEGRDMGSVVFPDAEVKFYLDADLTTRAARRQQEWRESGVAAAPAATLQDIAARDSRDQKRIVAPLVIPEGAHYIDTTGLQPEEVAAHCLAVIKTCRNTRAAQP
ncbi:MAG: (d)CMP kinase [Desulfobaccales bacterium]